MTIRKDRPVVSGHELAVAIFTFVYMAVSLLVALRTRNLEFVFYLVVMCILIAIVGLLHLRIRLHAAALWGLSAWGLAHMAGGLMPIPASWPKLGDASVLYNLWLLPGWLKYDQLVHAYGFGLVTWVCWQGIRRAFLRHQIRLRPSFGLLALCVASGMGFGAANEVVEFIATIAMPQTNVGGYRNTGWDLVANLVGCLLAAILIAVYDRRQPTTSVA